MERSELKDRARATLTGESYKYAKLDEIEKAVREYIEDANPEKGSELSGYAGRAGTGQGLAAGILSDFVELEAKYNDALEENVELAIKAQDLCKKIDNMGDAISELSRELGPLPEPEDYPDQEPGEISEELPF